jgi:hypothetical protein
MSGLRSEGLRLISGADYYKAFIAFETYVGDRFMGHLVLGSKINNNKRFLKKRRNKV